MEREASSSHLPDGAGTDPRPFLSVVVRTQGRRPDLLAEALLCLAAQSDDDLEVLLVVADDGAGALDSVRKAVHQFAPAFATRVRVLPIVSGTVGKPLNAGLDAARGAYLAFLDDDDVVTGDWVEVFRAWAEASPGKVIRAIGADQTVRRLRGSRAPYFEPTGPITVPEGRAEFDLFRHLVENRTPICAYAVPLDQIRGLGIRFDEQLTVMEDWLFLVQAALACGLVDTGRVTSVYRRWDDAEATWHRIETETWKADRRRVWEILDAGPLVLPPGSASAIRELRARAFAPRPAAGKRQESELQRGQAAVKRERELQRELAAVKRERDRALRRVVAIEGSQSWKMTAPIRLVLDAVKRLRRRS